MASDEKTPLIRGMKDTAGEIVANAGRLKQKKI